MANEQVPPNGQRSGNQSAGTTKTDGFGETSLVRAAETAVSAAAAQAQAAIQARYVMAMKNPRDLDNVRVRLLAECRRPSFADVARYRKPIGGKAIEGPSIRFAEAAIRCMTNVLSETYVIYNDSESRIVRVSVTDLEANVSYPTDIVIEKTVERSFVKDGQTVISQRMNSQGKITYLVPATEDDLLNKQNALVSKALRTNGLRVVPGDIVDECMSEVVRVQLDRDAKDPDAAKKKVIDGFAGLNIMPTDLKAYLGHEVAQISPAELAELRAVFVSIRDGETTWRDVLEHKSGKAAAQEAGKNGGAASDLKDRVKAQAEKASGTAREPASGG